MTKIRVLHWLGFGTITLFVPGLLAGTLRWTPVNGPTGASIDSLVANPGVPLELYASFRIDRNAIFAKSTDGGENWQLTPMPQEWIPDIAVDPKNPDLLYFTAPLDENIFQSRDRGISWTPAVLENPQAPVASLSCDHLKPSENSGVYCFNNDLDTSYFRSQDGHSWQSIDVASHPGIPRAMEELNGLAVQGGQTYLSLSKTDRTTYNPRNIGLYVSANDERSWSRWRRGPIAGAVQQIIPVPTDSAGFFARTANSLYQSRTAANGWKRLFKQGPRNFFLQDMLVDSTQPERLYLASSKGVFSSFDAGRHWQRTNGFFTQRISQDAGEHERLYAGDEIGIHSSTDGGKTWQPKNAGLYGLGIEQIVTNPLNTAHRLILTDNGVFQSLDSGTSWDPVLRNQGIVTAVDVAFSSDDKNAFYLSDGHALWSTLDRGSHWQRLLKVPKPDTAGYFTLDAMAINSKPSTTVYAAIGHAEASMTGTLLGSILYQSVDSGRHWRKLYQNKNDNIQAIAIDSSNSHRMCLLMLGSGDVLESVDGGKTWVSTPLQSRLHSLAISAGAVYAYGSGGLWKKGPQEQTWTQLSSESVSAMAFSTTASNRLYAVHARRVALSSDDGATWQPLEKGLPDFQDSQFLSGLSVSGFGNAETLQTATGGRVYELTLP